MHQLKSLVPRVTACQVSDIAQTDGALQRNQDEVQLYLAHTLNQSNFDLAIIVKKRLQVLVYIGGGAHEPEVKCAQYTNVPTRGRGGLK